MSDDEVKKTMDFLQREIARAVSGHLGEKLNKDSLDNVKASIQGFLDKLSKDQRMVVSDITIVADTIRYKLQQQSMGEAIFPTVKGPFTSWFQNGLVHLVGQFGNYDVCVCDYGRLSPEGYRCSEMLTCLECLTFLPPESSTSTVISKATTV